MMQTDFEKNSFHADAKRLGKITVDPGMESKLTSFLKKMTRGKSMAPAIFLMVSMPEMGKLEGGMGLI